MSNLLDHVSWEEPSWEEPAPGTRRWPVLLLGAVTVLALLYAGAAWALGDRVPRGTTVAGVEVGGQSAQEARATLDGALGVKAGRTLTLTSTAGRVEVDPGEAGLAVDVPGTVDRLTGFSLAPAALWRHLLGGGEEPAALTVDEGAFDRALEAARGELDAEPTEGSLSLEGGTLAYTEPVRGTTTDVDGTLAAVRRWWPGQSTVEVDAEEILPRTTAAEFQRVRDDFVAVAMSGPVTVEAGGTSFEVPPTDFAAAIDLTPAEDGTITPRADDEKLRAVVHAAAEEAGAEKKPKDAVVTFSGRKPTVKPHVPGVALDDASISAAVWQAISTSERTATVTTEEAEPEFTTEVAKATLPKEEVSSFTTYFQAGQARVKNIKRAASVLNGTYIKPGQQFSMNGILGERTKEKGYVEAGIIRNGRLADSVGGGISQVSTTIFNASFFAGVQLDAWQAHSFYISRYPEGREATISWPNLHNKWTNTLDGGILVEVETTDTSVTVTYVGRKKYDVEATKSDRYNVVQPKKITDDSPSCKPQNPVPGFAVDIGRVIRQGGKVVQKQSFTTRYQPEDDVTCSNPS
ncbi:VanW family protein [Phycicoccus sp. CSK15P-2]|uniref:VanW family protein n=1 Tax=Phycicoccus sp. CSK15P-2 TaxID=2807627 RepID=UPI001951E032|nr:VanW family protein [Phycicoccus sp. CSK15P-2]MBM6405642.1 VanW family protein [Phycicoccus sp. CSK15P-2]